MSAFCFNSTSCNFNSNSNSTSCSLPQFRKWVELKRHFLLSCEWCWTWQAQVIWMSASVISGVDMEHEEHWPSGSWISSLVWGLERAETFFSPTASATAGLPRHGWHATLRASTSPCYYTASMGTTPSSWHSSKPSHFSWRHDVLRWRIETKPSCLHTSAINHSLIQNVPQVK